MFEAIIEAVITVLFDSADETLSDDKAGKAKKILAVIVILTVLLITVMFLAFGSRLGHTFFGTYCPDVLFGYQKD